jgi:hypothetical protein
MFSLQQNWSIRGQNRLCLEVGGVEGRRKGGHWTGGVVTQIMYLHMNNNNNKNKSSWFEASPGKKLEKPHLT